MKAVMYKGPKDIVVEDVQQPRIEDPRDAIVKMTSAAICGSDLHMYEARTGAKPGTIFGHENMGVVSEVGPGVTDIRVGDRVVMPFNVACGFCFNCVRGFTQACLTTNPDQPSAAYGYVDMGPYPGGQAEYLRVPFADFNCLKLPGRPGDDMEDDFVLLADIFPTGYHAAELADVQPGSTVAVFGAGPVGLLAAYSALIRGASEVYVVDAAPERLRLAQSIGAIPIDFLKGDPVEQIFEIRTRNPKIMGAKRPGEVKMPGVMCGIDAVGYQAHGYDDPASEKPTQVIDSLVRVVNATGHIGLIGVYFPEDPGAKGPHAHGNFILPLGQIFSKGLSIGMGQTPVKKYNMFLRDLIIGGRAKPSFIVSHHMPLEQAPEAYAKFDLRGSGEGKDFTKVVLKP